MKTSKSRLAVRSIFWLLSVAIMVTIFCFSSQPGSVSNQTSTTVIESILSSFLPHFEALSTEAQETLIDSLQVFVRKGAHLSVFALLGCSIGCATLTHFWPQKVRYAVSFGISILYAASDELHQAFVPNRAPRMSDVLIDSCGAAIGILLALCLIGHFCRKHIRSLI